MLLILIALSALGLVACSTKEPVDAPESSVLAPLRSGIPTEVRAFPFEWAERPPMEVAERASILHEMVAGAPADLGLVASHVRVSGPSSLVTTDGRMAVLVDSRHDTVSVRDRFVSREGWATSDLGPPSTEQLQDVLDELGTRGLIDPNDYDVRTASLSRHRVAQGTRDGTEFAEAIVEYRFTMMPLIDGIAVATAGVTIGFGRQGRLRSLRVGGVGLPRATERASATSRSIPSGIDMAALRQRALASTLPPGMRAHVKVEMLGYVLRRSDRVGVVEPQYILEYAPIGVDDAGEEIAGRGIRVLVPLGPGDPVLLNEPTPEAANGPTR